MLIFAAAATFALAVSPTRPRTMATDEQLLFQCHADHEFDLLVSPELNAVDPPSTGARRSIGADIRVYLNAKSGQVKLVISGERGSTRRQLLTGIEQGSSPSSGASGQADTVIRGRDGPDTITLFAGYDTNGFDHSAALEIIGSRNVVMVCDDKKLVAPRVTGIGRYGSASIYTLAADGAATVLSERPNEPDIGYSP